MVLVVPAQTTQFHGDFVMISVRSFDSVMVGLMISHALSVPRQNNLNFVTIFEGGKRTPSQGARLDILTSL